MPNSPPGVDRTALRHQLIRHDRVQRLLRNSNWKAAAEAAIRFYVDGVPTPVQGWNKTRTWQQVYAAYNETYTGLQNQPPATENTFRRTSSGQPQSLGDTPLKHQQSSSSESKGPSAVGVTMFTVLASILVAVIGNHYLVPGWLVLALVGGAALNLIKSYVYAGRYGSWNEGQAALRRDEELRQAAKRQSKWESYRADCRNYTPEERYWRRFTKRHMLFYWLNRRTRRG
jgi:hypothetical protein